LGATCRFASRLNGRKQQGHEDSDDRDNDEQLDKRKRAARLRFRHGESSMGEHGASLRSNYREACRRTNFKPFGGA
jgi:hypothetical protein